MKGKISPDDLRPGKYIIVTEWLDETFKEDEREYDFWGRLSHREKPKKPVGIPFKVLAVALPFMTLEALFGATQQRGIFDTRVALLMEVDLDYVRSLVPSYKPVSRRAPGLSTDDRLRVQRWTAAEGWKEIREEKR